MPETSQLTRGTLEQVPDVIVLAGGGGKRLGGVDKPSLVVAGRTLLERVLAAVSDSAVVVVVGPRRDTSRPVFFVQEAPPGGGPVAALAAGLPYVTGQLVALLAADLPFLTPDVVRLLASRVGPAHDGALLVDAEGQDQLLVGVWRTAALRRAVHDIGPVQNAPLRTLLQRLDAVRVTVPETPQRPWWDCDTEDDLRRAEELA
jgi:molybdopterin-guanine dinucleotide biosynthesis protein A